VYLLVDPSFLFPSLKFLWSISLLPPKDGRPWQTKRLLVCPSCLRWSLTRSAARVSVRLLNSIQRSVSKIDDVWSVVLQLLSAFGAVRHLSGPTEVSLSDLCHVTYTGSDVTNLSDVIKSMTQNGSGSSRLVTWHEPEVTSLVDGVGTARRTWSRDPHWKLRH